MSKTKTRRLSHVTLEIQDIEGNTLKRVVYRCKGRVRVHEVVETLESPYAEGLNTKPGILRRILIRAVKF